MMTAAEKNAHYGNLNLRFDIRAEQLRARGFKYECVKGYELAVFTRPKLCRPAYSTIAAAFVQHADDVCWSDRLADMDLEQK
jgi:hypothetical protein